MKAITNWRNATCFDTETDDLLLGATKFHVLSFHTAAEATGSIFGSNHAKLIQFFQYHIKNKIPVVAHNGISFDIPVAEKILGIDLSELMVIDTLYLSWYLNTLRRVHGLGSFWEDYGVEKPAIEDWTGLSYAEYKYRCEEDVKIQVPLWQDLKARLIDMTTQAQAAIDSGEVGGKRMDENEVTYLDGLVGRSVDEAVDYTLTFLMFKADTTRLREKTMVEMDMDHIHSRIEAWGEVIDTAKAALEAVMPDVPKYVDKKKPAKPFLKDMITLSKSGQSWNEAIGLIDKTDEYGNKLFKRVAGKGDVLKRLSKLVAPNANSGSQLKDWLFSHGWKPQTYDHKKDEAGFQMWKDGGFRGPKPKDRMIPQISKEDEDVGGKVLCQSVIDLAERVPEVMYYQRYTTVKHRLDTMKGWLLNIVHDKFLQARVGGLTNTLREKHRGIVNVPGQHKPYGGDMRGSFVAGEGKRLMGSDLSGLEDRCKHHYMMVHDPEYVETMLDGDYDAHMAVALSAGLVDQQQCDDRLAGIKAAVVEAARRAGKSTNYACTYGAQPPTIARSAGVTLNEGKTLFKGYWLLNWAVTAIADEQYVFVCEQGLKWLVNPINGMCYALRKEGDRFSTLNQGTGSFFFDCWIDNILESQKKEFGHAWLGYACHDEGLWNFDDTPENEELMTKIAKEAIEKVNVTYKLRRKLGCDCEFGDTYAECH